jgi:hypothetical protein
MSSSSLIINSGSIPQNDPFSCCLSGEYIPRSLWCEPERDLTTGDLWIDYPFPEPLPELEQNKTDPSLAIDVKNRITKCISDIVQEANRHDVGAFGSELALYELITNATQYGGVPTATDSCLLVRLEWEFLNKTAGGGLSLAVSNPCSQLFDPTRFARMPREEFMETVGEGSNGHLATTALLGFLKENSSLYYVWHLPDYERIRLQVTPAKTSLDGQDAESGQLQLAASRVDSKGNEIEYSLAQFEKDVALGLPTIKVTVACTVG